MFAQQYKIIGINILKHRRLQSMSQEELAEVAGISRTKLSDIERGKGPYSIELIFLIAKALDMRYSQLLEAL